MQISYKSLLSVLGFSFFVGLFGLTAGCGGGGGSSGGSSGGTGGGGTGGGSAIEGIATPSAVSVVTAQNADQVQ